MPGFEWDRRKEQRNIRKHGVTFDEAMTVFGDQFAIVISDPRHSSAEVREVVLGRSRWGRLLAVMFTMRKDSVRIFSAREATRPERLTYEEESR